MKLDNFEPNYWLLFIILTWLLLILSIVIYKWKEKYPATMVIGVMLKRNVYLKHYMRNKNDRYNCKRSLCGNYGYYCNVRDSLFIIL